MLALRANEAVKEFAGKAVTGEQGDLREGWKDTVLLATETGTGVARERDDTRSPALASRDKNSRDCHCAERSGLYDNDNG